MSRIQCVQLSLVILLAFETLPGVAQTFACGAADDGILLKTTSLATKTTAGFDLGTVPAIAHGICHTEGQDKLFYFSSPAAEGSYRVTLELGGGDASIVTVRAEARRLMIEKLPIAAGATITRSFDVNVRVPEYTRPDGTTGRVQLKLREFTSLDWDSKLTLEFNGLNPSVRSISIEPLSGAKREPTLYLAGDSTTVDQDVEPWASWGQMLPRFFGPGIVIANNAESGETTSSFVSEQRLAKIMAVIQPGDYFFMQFAHNDQKPGAVPLDRYTRLLTDFVAQVRAKGATPVIITAMNRDEFDSAGKIVNTLGGYPEAARQVAANTHTALIDLNAMSKILFEAMGPAATDRAFMHYAAGSFPGQTAAINDNTHFNSYGAYELARCIVHGIRVDRLPISTYLDPTVPHFNPASPDAFSTFGLPFTPLQEKEDTTRVPQT